MAGNSSEGVPIVACCTVRAGVRLKGGLLCPAASVCRRTSGCLEESAYQQFVGFYTCVLWLSNLLDLQYIGRFLGWAGRVIGGHNDTQQRSLLFFEQTFS